MLFLRSYHTGLPPAPSLTMNKTRPMGAAPERRPPPLLPALRAAHRSSGATMYVLQPFLIGLSGAFGMSVGYALFDRVARAFSKRQPVD